MRSGLMTLRLNSWLVQQGGLRDLGGDLRAILGRYKDRPGLVNKARGLALDEAAERAHEAGYFFGPEPPTINELLDAIDQDHNGRIPIFPAGELRPPLEGREDPAIELLRKLVAIFRTHGQSGKRAAMRPILRECEVFLQGGCDGVLNLPSKANSGSCPA